MRFLAISPMLTETDLDLVGPPGGRPTALWVRTVPLPPAPPPRGDLGRLIVGDTRESVVRELVCLPGSVVGVVEVESALPLINDDPLFGTVTEEETCC